MEETMKGYELLCILSPKLEGVDLDKTKDEISEAIIKLEGTINFKESSKKSLAYPINKEKQGIFLTSQILIFPEKLIEFSKELKANKQILRHLVNQLEIAKEGPERTRTIKKSLKPKRPIVKKEEPEQKIVSGETLEEIDKKLDEIIGEI
ncbi:MAG: 30S ribosomal protein S6 [bacterium]|nr:30S ribosomal protein S6 [bacterium]